MVLNIHGAQPRPCIAAGMRQLNTTIGEWIAVAETGSEMWKDRAAKALRGITENGVKSFAGTLTPCQGGLVGGIP